MNLNIFNNNKENIFFLNKKYVINNFFLKFNQSKTVKNTFVDFIIIPFRFNNLKNFYLWNYKKIFKNNLFLFCGFSYSKVFLKVGLGFRKKYNRKNNLILLNVVRRKIVYFKPPTNSFFMMVRRRSLYVFASSKRKLFFYIVKFKSMRKETVYKYKGIFTNIRLRMYKRITKTILFARRIKFKKIKLKLNKKQKLKK